MRGLRWFLSGCAFLWLLWLAAASDQCYLPWKQRKGEL